MLSFYPEYKSSPHLTLGYAQKTLAHTQTHANVRTNQQDKEKK